MITENGYGVFDENGKPIGIDDMSGGMPYATDRVNQIHLFETETEANSYAAHFKGYTVAEIKKQMLVTRIIKI